MSALRRQAVQMGWLRRLLPLLLLAILAMGLAGGPATAAEPAPEPEVSAQEIDRLVKTLEDPKTREKLVRQLQALKTVQKKNAELSPASAVLAALTARVEAFGEELLDTTTALSDVPRLINWLDAQVRNETARNRWFEVIAKLLAVLIAGLVAEKLSDAVMRRPRRTIDGRSPETKLARAPLVLARAVLESIPIGAFAAAAYGAIPLLSMAPDPKRAALMLIGAYLTARVAMVTAHVSFMPRHAGLRLLPIGDETAHYLYIWARRLIGVTIYGYVLAGALRLLGLPLSGYEVLLKLLGLLVTTMAVVLILQNRLGMAAWLRSRGGDQLGHRLQQLRNRFADVWHVLASAYLAMIYGIWALRIQGGFDFMLRASLLTVAILVAAGFVASLVKRATERGFAVSQDLRRQFPQLEARVNRYLPVLHGVLRSLIGFATVMALLQTWGVDAFDWLSSDFGRRFASAGVTIAIVVVVALVIWEVASGAIERYLTQTDGNGKLIERSARARTLLPLLRNVIMVVLVLVVGLTVLSELGVNIAPLLAGAGVVGLAIGFGSQKLVQDLITGAFILFEDTISVGDVVKLGEHAGAVEAMSIRTIRLRDAAGAVHTIPFSAVSTIMNMTKDFSFAVFDIGVSYREDTDEVAATLAAIGDDLRSDPELGRFVLEPLEVLGVDRFGASEVVIKARLKTLPSKQWVVSREFNRRMKKRFDELGIEIPFPHQTVYFGEDKHGKAPPLHMLIERKKAARRPAVKEVPPAQLAPVDLPTRYQAGLQRRREDEEEEEEMADR